MKKTLLIGIALVAMVAFVGGAMAQAPKAAAPAAPADKPVADKPAADKPAADKPKAEKPKPPKVLKASGTVAAYEAGKMIKVKGAKDKEWTFEIAADAKIKGEVKEGAKVTVTYKKDGDKMIATAISGPAIKKPKTEKPAEAPKK
jgi:hypothetical protein